MTHEYIVGLRINKIPNTFDPEFNEGSTINEYEFITKNYDTLVYTSRKYVLEHGMCGSGYCTAETLNEDVEVIKEVGSLHYTPKVPVHWENRTSSGGNDFYELYENGCSYYPAASININFSNWRSTKRGKEVKPLYVFCGESAIGKSYVGRHSTLKVLETDYLDVCIYSLDPANYVDYEIVVLGNKRGVSVEDLKEYLKDIEVQVVTVTFES